LQFLTFVRCNKWPSSGSSSKSHSINSKRFSAISNHTDKLLNNIRLSFGNKSRISVSSYTIRKTAYKSQCILSVIYSIHCYNKIPNIILFIIKSLQRGKGKHFDAFYSRICLKTSSLINEVKFIYSNWWIDLWVVFMRLGGRKH
jgi:predicted Zn-dependent protease